MPVVQPRPPMLVQGMPGASQTMPRVISVLQQPQQVTTLPTGATMQQAKAGKPNHIPLARCRVLYLGSAVPLDTSRGIEAVQGPCRERYPFDGSGDVNGIDSWVSVFSSGMMLSYVNDKKGVTWFPIQSLYVCAAIKCVTSVDPNTGSKSARFVALDSEEAKGSTHPPMFACIMRRTKGVKVLECHVFITKSTKAAMALVQSCTHAYEHKEGWTDEPPQLSDKTNAPTRIVPAENQEERDSQENAPPEFYQKPPPQGFYYTSNKDLVKNYNVFGNEGTKERQAEGDIGVGRSGPPGAPLPPPVFYPPPPPASMMGPPGAPVPMPMPPPMPMYGPPFMGPGMYPMPPPPPGYFRDWDRYEGRPVAIFEDGPMMPRGGKLPPREHREGPPIEYREYRDGPPPRDYREGPPREYREGPPPREYREYREGPPAHIEYRRPVREEYERREPDYRPIREEYATGRRPREVYRAESPPRHSTRPKREEIVHEERYGSGRRQDYREPAMGHTRRYEDYRDQPNDLVLYAPHYRDRFPGDYTDYPEAGRRDGRDYVQYTSNFNPEIVMKGNREARAQRAVYGREEDDVYRYERQLPRSDERSYPRQEHGFGRSLQEERETIGDNMSEYRQDFDAESANIDYGFFRGGQRPERTGGRGNNGPMYDLENTLGYYP